MIKVHSGGFFSNIHRLFFEYLLTVEGFECPRTLLVNLECIQTLLCVDKLGGLSGAPREVVKL